MGARTAVAVAVAAVRTVGVVPCHARQVGALQEGAGQVGAGQISFVRLSRSSWNLVAVPRLTPAIW